MVSTEHDYLNLKKYIIMKKSIINHIILIPLCMLFLGIHVSCNQKENLTTATAEIIPIPVEIIANSSNQVFSLDHTTAIHISDAIEKGDEIAGYLNDLIEKSAGFSLEVLSSDEKPSGNSIFIEVGDHPDLPDEGYHLTVNKKRITISGSDEAGCFYGVITLFQLFNYHDQSIQIAQIKIKDYPRFKWRGVHLDVGRHFFPTEFIKEYLDIMALHKMNTFHWHLTEDQGWRIEIRKYPKLTEIGAWRDETMVGHYSDQPRKYDGQRHGGFYTHEEITEIVQYAADRFITIVPEIEMPGHARAAIASYPELGCTGEKVSVKQEWGISPYIYNVEDETFAFLEDVLTEVIELFPGEFIHIGGDEAIKDQWVSSKAIQQKIKALGLEDEHELQSYFIERIEKFLNGYGKRLIGWDEILEGGLAPNATVMSWRGTEGGIAAAKQHHEVVMTPTSHCYFDYYQSEDIENEPLAIGGFLPLEKVYGFEPLPEVLTGEESKYIIGAQANVWTEYIATPDHVEYMLLPRLSALAEVVWSPKEKKDWEDFRARLEHQVRIYEILGWNYRKPD